MSLEIFFGYGDVAGSSCEKMAAIFQNARQIKIFPNVGVKRGIYLYRST